MHLIFDGLKRYLAINGGTLVHIFLESDINGDMSVQREEFKLALYRMNTADLFDEQAIENIYQIYDMNNSNQVSYIEFLKQFYEYANQKMVKDPSDSIYTVLDTLRKHVKTQRKSLASIIAQNLMSN